MAAETKRDSYHHGNLREALIEAALAIIAERGLAGLAVAELARVVGVSPAAPYRHFRDRNAVIAEISRRGFEQLAADLEAALGAKPAGALERCAQAHLAFAARQAPVYAAMNEAALPIDQHPEVVRARDKAFAVLRLAAQTACDASRAPRRPPVLMVALHVWSLTHGIAVTFLPQAGEGRVRIPMSAAELLEAGLLIYLDALDLPPG